jgi:NAD+ synthase (glutamine-hydrolysing)
MSRGAFPYDLDMDDFLDVRGHGFARVAVCVPEVRPADPAFNAAAHIRVLERAYERGAIYGVCP